jgi:vitamin B12 transporter
LNPFLAPSPPGKARPRLRLRLRPRAPTHRPAPFTGPLPAPRPAPHGRGLCPALLLAAALALPAAAQTGETIVITGTRTPQRVDQALAHVTVIDRARIDAAAGRTLADLLAAESGLQAWSNGGPLKPASVSLRGLEARHVLLLVDGVRHGSATVGTPAWDNIPLDMIERIEIVRGPMSGLYGSDAVAGVVQIFTRRGQPGWQPEATLGAGSRGHREVAAGARFGGAAWDGSLRLQHRRSDGVSATNERVPFGSHDPDDDGWRQHSASAALGATLGTWRARGTLLVARGQTQVDDGPGVDARAALRTEVLTATAEGPLGPGLRTVLRVARSVDAYETLATASAFTPLGTIATTQDQFTWETQAPTPLGTALLVLEHLRQAVERPGAPFAVGDRRISAVGLGLNGQAGAHGWQASLRSDRNSQFGRQTTGALAWGWDLAPGLRATASAGRSFVAPSFNQLYFPNFGNPALQPEEDVQRELGLVWRHGVVTSRLAWYQHRIRSYIPSGPLPANIPRVEVEGVSASVDAAWGPWTLAAGIDSVDPLNATAGTANFGRVLPRRVRDSGRLALDWRHGALALGGTLLAFGERFENAANTLRMGGHAVLDLRADWALAREWTLGARLNNALGQRYETVYGYNTPGREALLTLRWTPR